jgi:hypothetical protein
MERSVLILLAILAAVCILPAQTPAPDSTRTIAADTLFVIPAGPVAGTFTAASRVTINDTVAGWAKVQVEGWVPVGAVIGRMQQQSAATSTDSEPPARVKPSKKNEPRQCAATTTKGTRCKRNAAPGSIYCWQHQK